MSSKTVSLQDLREQCKALGLITDGNKAALSKRVQDHVQASLGSSKEREESGSDAELECDAGLMTRSAIGGQEG